MKYCNSCKLAKPIESFPKNKTKRDGLAHNCKSCKKIQQANWYNKHKVEHAAKVRLREEKIKQLIIEEKSKPCADCGHSYPHFVMDFDHLDNKKFSISGSQKRYSFDRIKEEISKCELVCANCHRIRTQGRIAPMAEQEALNFTVLGSNPSAATR